MKAARDTWYSGSIVKGEVEGKELEMQELEMRRTFKEKGNGSRMQEEK